MAEWFKATDLRPVINDAWVRTPLSAQGACTKQTPKKESPKPFFMIHKIMKKLCKKLELWDNLLLN